MPHVVLLGDSVFDNAAYVPGALPVVEQLRELLPEPWRASLLALDGSMLSDVARQLERLPEDATHLAISVGGNDAMRQSGILGERFGSVPEMLLRLGEIQSGFRGAYRAMLAAVRARVKPAMICTIYNPPEFLEEGLAPVVATALSIFNDVVVQEAVRAGVPVLDLRLVCAEQADFSELSAIEPSAAGGAKIAESVRRVVTQHDFARGETVVFGAGAKL